MSDAEVEGRMSAWEAESPSVRKRTGRVWEKTFAERRRIVAMDGLLRAAALREVVLQLSERNEMPGRWSLAQDSRMVE